MPIRFLAPFALLLPVLTVGCVAETDDELEPLDARSEYPPLPPEDSPVAYGMLRVANELDFAALDVDVALDRRSAESIIAHRAGPDGVLETADDAYVATIAELDGLYWLGEANLWKIQNYAIVEGYVPEELPIPTCDPALGGAIAQCLRFVEDAAVPVGIQGSLGWEPFAADLRESCLEQSDPSYPSDVFFDDAGAVPYLDPRLGYQELLCASSPEGSCALGVAGMASYLMPECEALYDVAPVLTEHAADPAHAADWAAALAALDASCFDCSHSLRVLEHAPGMAPTLLGDVMEQVLASAPFEYQGPWLQREPSDVLPPLSAGAQALLGDVIADLGLTGASFDVGTATEEVPCHNCHEFHDAVVLMFREARVVVVLDIATFWDS